MFVFTSPRKSNETFQFRYPLGRILNPLNLFSMCPAGQDKLCFGVMGVTFLQFSSGNTSSPCLSLLPACNSSWHWHQHCTAALSILALQHALTLALTHIQPQVCLSIACAKHNINLPHYLTFSTG